ncbi:MAG: magnesium transporter [Planctomycetota bacterium]|nr:MAG: magnesium transporter [Planctomycetota bacterium]
MRRRERRHRVLEACRTHLAQPEGTPFLPDEGMHPADIADVLWLDFDQEEARTLFTSLSLALAADVLSEAEPALADKLVEGMDPQRLGRLFAELPADDATDILGFMTKAETQEILQQLEPEDARDLRHLGVYPGDSAGGMMTTEFITAREEEKVGDVLKRLKRTEDLETIDNAYVVDDEGYLAGVLSSREMLEASIHDPVREVMNPDVIQARVEEDQENVAHKILHYNLSSIPVVDPRGIVVGIVTADDALEVLEEEGTEDAMLLAGAGMPSAANEPLLQRVLHRAPMLAVTVAAGILMSRVMDYFAPQEVEGTGEWGTIVPYVPMVLALAGTIGAQTSAVLVRGFAVGLIPPGRRWPVFLQEIQVGGVLGLLCFSLSVPAAALFAGDWFTGFSLGVALLLAMSWTSVVASSIAMGSELVGLDPALVAGPVMIAVSDLSAVLLFFGIATLMLTPAAGVVP